MTTASRSGCRAAARSSSCGSSEATLEPQAARDDLALHLGGAGVERARQCVTQLALDRVLLHVAVAAVDLERVERGAHVGFAHEQLGHRGLEHRALALLLEP